MLPHLDAAYNLARWLTRKDHDAEDVVQEAYLRAWKSFGSFRGGDGRAWLLATVRNTCYTWLEKNRDRQPQTPFDEKLHGEATESWNPVQLKLREEDVALLHEAIDALPVEFREIIVLRDLEGFSYKEIADIACLPLGTVMSRLARGRERLQQTLVGRQNKGTKS
jgi:RNA polymerase sigma-70 factor (ECF subfamily)